MRSSGSSVEHASVPQHVVADVEPADADPLACGPPGVGIALLVDVVVDHVELAVERVERRDRVADVVRDARPQSGPPEVVLRLAFVLRVAVREVQLAAGADRARVPVARVPEARSELDHAASPDRPSQDLERHADVASHDREIARLRLGLHLREDRLVETREPRPHVLLDARIHDVHGVTLVNRT